MVPDRLLSQDRADTTIERLATTLQFVNLLLPAGLFNQLDYPRKAARGASNRCGKRIGARLSARLSNYDNLDASVTFKDGRPSLALNRLPRSMARRCKSAGCITAPPERQGKAHYFGGNAAGGATSGGGGGATAGGPASATYPGQTCTGSPT